MVTFLISVLCFLLLKSTGSYSKLANDDSGVGRSTKENIEFIHQRRLANKMAGFHLPTFYVSFSSLNHPGHLDELEEPMLRKWLDRMVHMGYDGDKIKDYVLAFQQYLVSTTVFENHNLQIEVMRLFAKNQLQQHQQFWQYVQERGIEDEGVSGLFDAVLQAGTTWRRFFPTVHFYAKKPIPLLALWRWRSV